MLNHPPTECALEKRVRARPKAAAAQAIIKDVFGDPAVYDLKLRFDPDAIFVGDRITKGLVENLMLRRARVTIYNAGGSDR